MTKTKSGMGSKLAAFVAVIVIGGFFYGWSKNLTPDKPKDELAVSLSVIFEPKSRTLPVIIIATLDKAIVVNEDRVTKSPWKTEILMRRGQTITLTASQTVAARLSCAINGMILDTTSGPDWVTCRYKRP